jgi:uncharacterized membrane protein YqhA
MKNDPLDWNGDHIHTNFKVKLKNSLCYILGLNTYMIQMKITNIRNKSFYNFTIIRTYILISIVIPSVLYTLPAVPVCIVIYKKLKIPGHI